MRVLFFLKRSSQYIQPMCLWVFLKVLMAEAFRVAKVAAYEQYKEDLKLLKTLVREFAPKKYDEFFRGRCF